jgi:uncharacterized repeat protein (TIGR01451 family)
LLDERNRVRRDLPRLFPDKPGLVLPTRLGNVVRAFERYPTVQYEIDAIYFWPRLVAVIPGDYATAIDAERTSFVFLLTVSFLCAVLALATVLAGLLYLPSSPGVRVALPAAAFAGLSYWLYGRLLRRGQGWGEMVKGAFDLYRWELLKQLGYHQELRTRSGERALWKQITRQVMFGDRRESRMQSVSRVDYTEPAEKLVSARGTPATIELEVLRGVGLVTRPGELEVTIEIVNPDPLQDANGVVVTDTLRGGLEYVSGSARAGGAPIRVTGINPYRFHVGAVRHAEKVVLTFAALRVCPCMDCDE